MRVCLWNIDQLLMAGTESQMLHGEVQSPKVWAKNLNQLRENTEWKINELDDGSFSIEPVHP